MLPVVIPVVVTYLWCFRWFC